MLESSILLTGKKPWDIIFQDTVDCSHFVVIFAAVLSIAEQSQVPKE